MHHATCLGPTNHSRLVQPGKTYRLRIVNTSAFAAFFFWIDGHDMRIIEADGVRTIEFCVIVVLLMPTMF